MARLIGRDSYGNPIWKFDKEYKEIPDDKEVIKEVKDKKDVKKKGK